MTVAYTSEGKLAKADTDVRLWGSAFNGNFDSLDAGFFITLEAGENIDQYSACCIAAADGKMYKADANVATRRPCIGMAPAAITSGSNGRLQLFGWMDYDDSAFSSAGLAATRNDLLYLCEVAGELTVTPPANPQVVGIAKTSTAINVTRILINPDLGYKTQLALIAVEDLAAGADIANRPIFVSPTKCLILSAGILTQGAPADVDDANTSVILLEDDASNALVTKTYNTGTQPPTNDYEDLGSLSNVEYTAAEHMMLSVTNGVTADLPAFMVVIEYMLIY